MQLKANVLLQGGKYRIIRVLGQGGFGITYEAEVVALKKSVAIKEFFIKEYCDRDEATGRVKIGSLEVNSALVARFKAKFIREAQLIASLDHPNIVKTYDVFEENGTAYYVMDYLAGSSLADVVRSGGALSESEALLYIGQIADALAYLHSRHSLHFDVKPANILLDSDGRAVLIDFGVSKHYDESGQQTSSTPVGLSEGYAPLEQYRHSEIGWFTPATDIYALGATLFFLLSGQAPPSASVVHEEGLPALPSGIIDPVKNAVWHAMRPKRKDRPQSIQEFVALLTNRIADDVTSEQTRLAEPDEEAKTASGVASRRKRRWLYIASSALLAALAALLFIPEKAKEQDGLRAVQELRGTIMNREYVDLGLNVYWAAGNLDQITATPYGTFRQWPRGRGAEKVSWSDLVYCSDGKGKRFTKYVTNSDFGEVDNLSVIQEVDDATGSSWRMPKAEDVKELIDNCKWEWTQNDGENGYLVTGPSGESIFFPAGGYRNENGWQKKGEAGLYWTASLNTESPDKAICLYFTKDTVQLDSKYRYYAGLVHCVLDKSFIKSK